MTISTLYRRHCFPREIIAHLVWLYARFHRRWGVKFGPIIARELRRRAPRSGEVWHLDEVRVVIRGRVRWLWRAVDRDGVVLDEILQRRLLISLLKKQGWRPRRIVTDKLPSYGAARREIAPGLEHRAHKGLNNRAKNSHVPFRKRERQMQSFRSPGGLQRFVSVFSNFRNLFVPPARRSALATRLHRLEALDLWREATGLTASSPRRSPPSAPAAG